jgi:MoaA/NifB/PqqE/SkfB family radical SAM enzyme
MSHKDIYCTAPWNGLTIRENSQVKTCCVGYKLLGNLNTQTIQEIEKSDTLVQIQQDMLSGNPNLENCGHCVQQEKHVGRATLREFYLKYHPTIDDQFRLRFLDIRWNNVCNLGCLYCSPTFSNTWADRLGTVVRNLPVKDYQDDLLEWILERVEHINELMLVGGEPLLMKQNYKLLERLPNDCQIGIITNLSYDLEKNPALPSLLNRPHKKINWNISLENIGDKFEYVRSGANWGQVKKNFELLLHHWPETVSVNMVYSLFSAFDIVDTVQQLHSIGIKKFNLFNINENDTIDIFNLPDKIKELALAQLQEAQEWHTNAIHPDDREFFRIDGADVLIAQLKIGAPAKISLAEFDSKIQWYDQWSTKKFANLWPDVSQLICSTLK